MILGLLTGRLLRSELSPGGKVGRLLVAGLAGLVLGQILAQAGLCPIVKLIWSSHLARVFGAYGLTNQAQVKTVYAEGAIVQDPLK